MEATRLGGRSDDGTARGAHRGPPACWQRGFAQQVRKFFAQRAVSFELLCSLRSIGFPLILYLTAWHHFCLSEPLAGITATAMIKSMSRSWFCSTMPAWLREPGAVSTPREASGPHCLALFSGMSSSAVRTCARSELQYIPETALSIRSGLNHHPQSPHVARCLLSFTCRGPRRVPGAVPDRAAGPGQRCLFSCARKCH